MDFAAGWLGFDLLGTRRGVGGSVFLFLPHSLCLLHLTEVLPLSHTKSLPPRRYLTSCPSSLLLMREASLSTADCSPFLSSQDSPDSQDHPDSLASLTLQEGAEEGDLTIFRPRILRGLAIRGSSDGRGEEAWRFVVAGGGGVGVTLRSLWLLEGFVT